VEQLFSSAGEGSFFSLPGWYDLVSRHGMRPGWRPRLFVNDAATAGLVLQRNERTGEMASCSNPYTCEYDAIFCGDTAAVRDLACEIAKADPRAFAILLQGFDPAAKSFNAVLNGLGNGGYRTRDYFCWGNWREDTRNRAFEDYLAARPSSLLHTWKRKHASVGKSLQAETLMYAPGDPIEPFIAAYEQVYGQSWKEPEPFPRFIPELIGFAAEIGALRLGVLKLDGKVAAAQFWIVWREKALLCTLAFADGFRAYSPGTLLTMQMLQAIFEQDRPDAIDFGRGDDPYKKLWVSERHERWGIEAVNTRTIRGMLRAARMVGADFRRRARRK